MRRRFLTSLALVLALAPAAFAQAGAAPWVMVAPEGEEFVVRLPARPLKVARILPFGEGVQLVPASYEAASGKARFSVLSFKKSREDVPATLDQIVDGLRHALLGAQSGDYLIEHERDLTLDGRAGKQFALRTGSPLGTARVFDAADHFYVLIASGARAGEPEADRFFSSFRLDQQSRRAAQPLRLSYTDPADAPSSFWPGLPVSRSIGIIFGGGTAAPEPKPTPQPEPKVIEGGILNGKALSKPQPAYPAIARAARASGTVAVRVVIDEEGRVISASAVSGHPLLQQAAVAAARQARFPPTLLSGQPARVRGVVTYNFVLQ